MGIHDGPELNRPYFQFSIDPDREPFIIAEYKVSDETYPSYVVYSDGSVRFSADGSGAAAQGVAITSLTDSSGGTPGNTIADVPASYTEATLANQLASLTAKVNDILARLRSAGVIAT